MKKYITSIFVIATFVAYVFYQRTASTDSTLATSDSPATTPVTTPLSTPAVTPPVTPPPTKKVVTPAPKLGQYKDGKYVGDSADAYYGNLQVEAIIVGGKLTDVQFLSYPNDRNTSRTINMRAMSQLRQEAIAAQNANVDTVSGATDSSGAFRQSLGTALTQAKQSQS